MKHDMSWEKFTVYYRSLLARIQKRYDIKASMPWNIDQVNDFLDRKESKIYNNIHKFPYQ